MKADTVVSSACDTSGPIVLLPCPPTVLLPEQPVPLFVRLPPSAYAIPEVTSSGLLFLFALLLLLLLLLLPPPPTPPQPLTP